MLHVFKFCFTGQGGSRDNASKILVFGRSPFRIAVAIPIFPGVSEPLQTESWMLSKLRPLVLPFTSLSVHYSPFAHNLTLYRVFQEE